MDIVECTVTITANGLPISDAKATPKNYRFMFGFRGEIL